MFTYELTIEDGEHMNTYYQDPEKYTTAVMDFIKLAENIGFKTNWWIWLSL